MGPLPDSMKCVAITVVVNWHCINKIESKFVLNFLFCAHLVCGARAEKKTVFNIIILNCDFNSKHITHLNSSDSCNKN